MPAYRNAEYAHLLAAERTIAQAIEDKSEGANQLAQAARALVDIIRCKRDMRGVPDPRPVDVSKPARKRKPPSGPDVWTDPTAPPK